MCLYVYECALLERWMYVLYYVSCMNFSLPIYVSLQTDRDKKSASEHVAPDPGANMFDSEILYLVTCTCINKIHVLLKSTILK